MTKRRRKLIIGTVALVLASAGVALWFGAAESVPDVVWICDYEDEVWLDATGRTNSGWTWAPVTHSHLTRPRGATPFAVALARSTTPPSAIDRARSLLGIASARPAQVFIRCDIWSIDRARRAAHLWTGWTDAEYAAAAESGDGVIAARMQAAARIGDARFRALAGRPPDSPPNPR